MNQDNQKHQNNRRTVCFFVFSASIRTASLNTQLAKLAARKIEEFGGRAKYANFSDFDCPSYNQDVQENHEFPAGAVRFREMIGSNDGFIIVSPEYNFSMPGHLKNVIDWVSRFQPQPFNEKHALLMSASPSMGGGNRGLWSLRIPLEHLGTRVYPDMFSLAMAHQAFNDNFEIANPALQRRFDNTLISFIDLVEAAKHYPCIKNQWIEFLGEQPNSVIDRVE